ncbi:unnamed protein product [Knipowitschia caucasica]
MLRGWRRGTLAVIGLLLCFFALQLSFFFTGREVLKLREQTLNILSPGIGSGLLPLNVSYQLLMGSAPSQQRFLVVGLSSVRRKKEMYLKSTLQSIFSQSSEEERAQMVVVVLLADFDWSWRQLVTEELQTSFYKELRQGQLLLIHVPQEQYPPLTGLKRNYNDAADRVSFRSKQNVDYSFLIHFCSSLGQFYLQLEDDVYCAKHFLSNIRQHIKEQNAKKTNWAMLEFSNLGFIGKLYKSTDLPILAQFLFLFYQEMPCDWLMSRFRDLLTQKEPIILRPSLFQHMGTISSFRGSKNELKDKDFEDGYSNPEAELFTNMKMYKKHATVFAWTPGEEFFWAQSPSNGDYLTAVLKTSAVIEDILVETGDGGKDILNSAEVEIGMGVINVKKDEKSCKVFVSLGKMEKGNFEMAELDKKYVFRVSCIRIRVTAGQSEWLMVKRIRITTKRQSTTML